MTETSGEYPTANPYAPPAELHLGELLPPDPLGARRKQLAVERIVKVLGWAVLAGLVWTIVRNFGTLWARFHPESWTWQLSFVFQTLFPVWLGLGLAFLWPSARIVGTLVAVVVAFGWELDFPLSLIPAFFLLFVVHSRWTRDLFSPIHQILRQATPELDLRRPTILFLALAAVLGIYAVMSLAARWGA